MGTKRFMLNEIDITYKPIKSLLKRPQITSADMAGWVLLWSNLIGFNGSCWQSYGPIGAFRCFEPEDIFFFATENNPEIEDETDIYDDVENDPLPYMMLLSGASFPRTFHEKDEMIIMMAEHELGKLDTARMKKTYKYEFDTGVYRFRHKDLGEPPHFAEVYFDENKGILLFSAMTEVGFHNLIKDFNTYGYNFPEVPYLRVRPQMVMTAEGILNKNIQVNEYAGMFHKDKDPEDSGVLDNLNEFIALVLPDLNANRMPDIAEAARKTGVDLDTAQNLVDTIMKKRG
ncbi:MAG: hypothetical protein JW801_08020 [Bacteroidales bacterium]|nr:hypothetical protein [Bacteroidales bacterium]